MVREFQSVIGARSPPSDRRAGRQAARLPSSPASAAAATPWASSMRSSTTATCGWSASRPAAKQIIRGRHAARFAGGSEGVLQGTRTFVLQDEDGNIELTHSISAGLDYAAVGPGTCLAARRSAAPNTLTSPTTRRSRRFRRWPARRDHARARIGARDRVRQQAGAEARNRSPCCS